MLAANNLYEVYDKIIADVKTKIKTQNENAFVKILNAKNSTGNTPLRIIALPNG